MDLQLIWPVISTLLTGLFVIISWWARSSLKNMTDAIQKNNDRLHDEISEMTSRIEARIDAHHDDLHRVERHIYEVEAAMPTKFVLRDDHIRHITILERKIDAVLVNLERRNEQRSQ